MRGLASLGVAAVVLLPSLCNAALELRADPAWGGAAAAGAVTEIEITVLATTARRVTLTATSAAATVEQPLSLEADSPMRVSVPVRVDASGLVSLSVTSGEDLALREIALSLRGRGLTVATRGEVSQAGYLAAGVDDFPRLAQAYEAIRTVITDVAAFEAMEVAQRAALSDFAGGCGRIIFVGRAPLPQQLLDGAGCGGRHLAIATNDYMLPATLERLGDAPSLPGATALASLTSHDKWATTWWTVCGFVLAYCVILSGLAGAGAKPATLFSLCALAFVASLLIGTSGATVAAASWSVAESGSPVRRVVSLLRVDGTGRGESSVTLGGNTSLPVSVAGNAKVVLQRMPGSDVLSLDTQLFSVSEFAMRGIRREPEPLLLELAGDSVLVTNPTALPSAPALLDWHGAAYQVPSLAAGDTWQPDKTDAITLDNAARRLWRQQAAASDASLLMRLAAGSQADAQQPGDWLMLLPSGALTP